MGKAAATHLSTIMGTVWHLFEAAPPVFEALVIPNADDGADGHDPTVGGGGGGSDGNTTALARGSNDGGSAAVAGGEGGADGAAGAAGDGDVTFETVVEQMYEFLLTVQGSAALQPQLKGALRQVSYNTICFMQVRRCRVLAAMHQLHVVGRCAWGLR